jgi:hypothetical protein
MPANYILLERIELNASAASVTFSNIPQTGYTDLKVVASSRGSSSGPAEANRIHFNGDTTNTNYTGKRLLGSGSAASSDQTTAITPGFFNNLAGTTANTFSNSEVYIPNYTGSSSKSYSIDTVTENNGTEAYAALVAVRWSGTAAITSMTFTPESAGNFVSGSTFSLYGLAALGTTPVIAPKASGGSIYNDGTYWYHAFRTSGTFTPQTSLSCEALVVAGGGGGGGRYYAGGGGAGGVLAFTGQSFSTAQTVTIGGGGAGGTADANGTQGQSSTLGSLTSAIGGGYGAGGVGTTNNGGNGGSGGGAANSVTTASGGTATSGQGYRGGNVSRAGGGNTGGAGGGGAGAQGVDNTDQNNGSAGGAGLNTWSSWLSAVVAGVSGYIAGGGGGAGTGGSGAAGGSGGGGAGANFNTAPGAGTINTGSGGGGASGNTGGFNTGGAGGSGLVIIRYAI